MPEHASLPADHALEYVLGIVIVLIALGVFAWVMRRVQARIGAGNASLRVSASLPLGGKERLLVVEAEGERLLLGVGPGGVQLLRRLRAVRTHDVSEASGIAPDSWLARTLRGAVVR